MQPKFSSAFCLSNDIYKDNVDSLL